MTEEITQEELQTACEGIMIRLNDSTKGNRIALIQMLMNVTINTLVSHDICIGCYIVAILETLEEVEKDQSDNVHHFDIGGSELTKVNKKHH